MAKAATWQSLWTRLIRPRVASLVIGGSRRESKARATRAFAYRSAGARWPRTRSIDIRSWRGVYRALRDVARHPKSYQVSVAERRSAGRRGFQPTQEFRCANVCVAERRLLDPPRHHIDRRYATWRTSRYDTRP